MDVRVQPLFKRLGTLHTYLCTLLLHEGRSTAGRSTVGSQVFLYADMRSTLMVLFNITNYIYILGILI